MNSLANLLKPFLLGFVLNFLKSKGPNQTFFFRIFRVLHTVQSLIFKVLCCSLSQTAHICYHKLFCLSRTFLKSFWSFVVVFSQQQLLYVSILFRICQQLFSSFLFCWNSFAPAGINHITVISSCQQLFMINFIFLPEGQKNNHLEKRSGERGIWTLAPVSRPTPLAGAPLQPLEYFSSPEFL